MTVIFNDTFTEASDTALASHTPDTGTSWTLLWNDGTAGYIINATSDKLNGITSNNSGAIYTADATYTSADYEVVVSIAGGLGTLSSRKAFILARVQDQENMYAVSLLASSLSNASQLYKKVGGTWTALGSAFTGPADGSVCKLIVNGTSISFQDDGVTVASATDSDISAAGKAGLAIGGGAEMLAAGDDSSSFVWFDGFSVDTLGGTAMSDQDGFRFRADDGDEDAASWLAAEDTNASVDTGNNFRLRLQVDTTNDLASSAFRLEYRRRDALYKVPEQTDTWTLVGDIIAEGGVGAWDEALWMAAPGCIIKNNGIYYVYYTGAFYDVPLDEGQFRAIGVATSTDGVNFTKHGSNPLVTYTTSSFTEEEEGASRPVIWIDGAGVWHMYYAASRHTTGTEVDVDVRYRTSVDGITWTGDTLIYSVGGDEYKPIGVFFYNSVWSLYIRGPLVGGAGPVKRLYGSSPTSLPSVDSIGGTSYQGGNGWSRIGENIWLDTAISNSATINRHFSYDQRDPNVMSAELSNYTFTNYAAGSVFLDHERKLWMLVQYNGTGGTPTEPLALRTTPAVLDTEYEYGDWTVVS